MLTEAPRVSTDHLSYKTYVTLANMQSARRQDPSRRFHFSALVKANRAGGNMFDQGKRYDPKFAGFQISDTLIAASSHEVEQVIDGDGFRLDMMRGYPVEMLDRGVTFVKVNPDGTTSLMVDESML